MIGQCLSQVRSRWIASSCCSSSGGGHLDSSSAEGLYSVHMSRPKVLAL
jgi:hypothetical protein